MLSATSYGVSFAKQYREDQIAAAERRRLVRTAKQSRVTGNGRPPRQPLARLFTIARVRHP